MGDKRISPNLEEQLRVKTAVGFHSSPFSLPTQENYGWPLGDALLCSSGYSTKNESEDSNMNRYSSFVEMTRNWRKGLGKESGVRDNWIREARDCAWIPSEVLSVFPEWPNNGNSEWMDWEERIKRELALLVERGALIPTPTMVLDVCIDLTFTNWNPNSQESGSEVAPLGGDESWGSLCGWDWWPYERSPKGVPTPSSRGRRQWKGCVANKATLRKNQSASVLVTHVLTSNQWKINVYWL